MAETSGLRQFFILLYKGALLRKRHFIVTFFEIVIPILIASIPAIIQSETQFPHTDYYKDDFDYSEASRRSLWVNYTTYKPFDPYDNNLYTSIDLELVYTPPTGVAGKFMSDAAERFRLGARYNRGKIILVPKKDEATLEAYCVYQAKNGSNRLIGTVLNNFEKELPESLSYKIRYMGHFYTDMKYRVNGPQWNNAYTDTWFLSWQTAVEETFIQEHATNPLDYKVWMQRFPYPEHRDSSRAFSVINIVPWVIAYGYLIFIINIVRRVIEEKANGSKELLKMMGMTDTVYWLSTFVNYFAVGFLTVFVLTIIYKSPLKYGLVFLKNIDFFLLLISLTIYMASLILFCLAFTVFFKKAVFAIVCLIIIYLLSFSLLMSNFFLLDIDINYFPLPATQKVGICLIPPGSLLTMFTLISYYESGGDGIQWSNLTEYSVIPDLNMLMVLATSFVSCLMYIFILWYFDAVWPWQPGVPKPFYFFFTRSYWCGYKPVDAESDLLVQNGDNSSEFFEEEPPGTTPGVVIRNLSKEFKTGFQTKSAVNNVSLNIYQGQITAILGHNGAGKTTTINILTGLYTPSSGSASISGIDILTDTVKARRGIGVCPQHNVLYDTLTVEEHLKIYAALKGVKFNQLATEATNVLSILKLHDKRTELIKNLSGGMKRKLSLGIAIVGGSKVLFLDEPTSGMDVEARRSVWDALLDIRRNRTIILTTHYMEEADILGDRIAIMAEGEVQCCGSPIYLKQKFGTGYHLHVVKDTNFDHRGVNDLLRKFIPDAKLSNELDKDISYNLSTDTSAPFGDMFEDLERDKVALGVISYGITITTMEDVFLKVASMSDLKYKQPVKEEMNGVNGLEIEDVYGENAEFRRRRDYLHLILALLTKRFHYAKRYWSVLAAQIILPFVMICILLYGIKASQSNYGLTYQPLDLNVKSVYGSTDGFFYAKRKDLGNLPDIFHGVLSSNGVTNKGVPEPTHYVLDYGKGNIARYLKSFMVGGAFDRYENDTWNVTAWYNGEPYHALPMSLTLMHTSILRNVSGKDSSYISLVNAPLPESNPYVFNSNGILERIFGAIFVPLALSYLSGSFVLVPTHERNTKAKLLQLMTGMPAAVYWAAMFLWDFMVYFLVSILLIIPFAIFSHPVFFGVHSDAMGTAFLLLLLYGWASIPLSYLVSFLFKKGSTGFAVMEAYCAIIGCGLGASLRAVQISDLSPKIDTVLWFFRIFPTFAVSSGFASLFGSAYSNAFCETLPDLKYACDDKLEDWNPIYKCCKDICGDKCLQQVGLLTFNPKSGAGPDAMFLAIDGFIYFALLLFVETPLMGQLAVVLKKHFLTLRKRVVGQVIQDVISDDSGVLAEEERIRQLCANRGGSGDEALAVLGLTKIYRNFYAVNRLTFGIHPEECFGLLGVNGAGKTTTFRMLVGDCIPTEGTAIVRDCNIQQDLKRFQSFLGYCPQFDALIDRLTGREMLSLFARLRGVSGAEVDKCVKTLIKMTDLTPHADKQTQFYSGGNKRKLSVALALIGSPPLLLLDEPTAGVDPVSRRKIWNILSQARSNTGAAVILTTHSMEESEALCSRLAIMVNGRFRCLGSIQELKSKYGQGYTLIIKLKSEQQHDRQAVQAIQQHVEGNLAGASLKDDHQGMLQYHIVDPSVTLSRLFKFMSKMKVDFELEDYLISDTSLEQIFLTFARSQRIVA